MKKYFVCCLCAVMACGLTACGDKKKGVRDAAEYQTMVVSKKDMMLTQPYSARLTGRQIVEIRPQVTGNITRILTAEGKTVRKGQTLFIIDQTPFQAALEVAIANRQSAEAKLSTAKMNYDSQLKLKEGSVVSDFSVETTRHELLEAQAALVQAQAQEKNARWQLSCTEVKSPVDGVASMIPWHVGALVGSNISEPLVTVADDSQMYAYFSVTERAVINLIDRYGSTADFINKAPSIKLPVERNILLKDASMLSVVRWMPRQGLSPCVLRSPIPSICCVTAVRLRCLSLPIIKTVSSFRRRLLTNCRTVRLSIVLLTARRRLLLSHCFRRITARNTLLKKVLLSVILSLPKGPDY